MRGQIEQRAWRATFRNMKVNVLGTTEVIPCDLEMELRPVLRGVNVFQILYVRIQRPISSRLYTRQVAQEKLRLMFQEQLTPWRAVGEEEIHAE